MKRRSAVATALVIAALAIPALSLPASAASKRLRLCGYVENPTPGNWWLTDRSGQWIIGVQGGHQAAGDLPDFQLGRAFWINVQPNGYGYGCGCIDATVDTSSREVSTIYKATVQRLKVCRHDKALKKPSY